MINTVYYRLLDQYGCKQLGICFLHKFGFINSPCLFFVVINTMTQSQLKGKRSISTYNIKPSSETRIPRQELKYRAWRRVTSWLNCRFTFRYIMGLDMVVLTVAWTLLYILVIKKMSHRHCQRPVLSSQFFI